MSVDAIPMSPDLWTRWCVLLQNNAYERNHPFGDGPTDEDPQTLYCYVDRDSRILYIGITRNLGGRHIAHARSSRWFAQSGGYYWYSWVCCRRCVLEMERDAIRLFSPEFNTAGKR